MLELDLHTRSAAEIEKAVAEHCAQLGTVTNVAVRLMADESGEAVALVSMSTDEEFERVFANFGESKIGAFVVIHILQERAEIMAAHYAREPADILLVEDNPADVRMTREALRAAGAPHQLHVVENGADAISFLYREGKFSDVPRPDLILLDLNIPKVNGHEVLLEIKSNEHFKAIPVVVLTSSTADSDVRRSYRWNADCFVTKPTGLDAFAREIALIESLLRH